MRLAIAIGACLAAFVAGNAQDAGGSPASSRPLDPGGIRVVENGEWLLMREFASATGTVTIVGDPEMLSLRKIERGWVATVNWDGRPGTWVDVDIERWEARAELPAREP